jgi:DNA-directed RNA polymerase sigma subunit (sigma70/sigma32)
VTEADVVRVLQELHNLWEAYANDEDDWEGDVNYISIGVLNLRFGLLGGPPHSMSEVAALLGVPWEQVREIENRLLTRIAEGASA